MRDPQLTMEADRIAITGYTGMDAEIAIPRAIQASYPRWSFRKECET